MRRGRRSSCGRPAVAGALGFSLHETQELKCPARWDVGLERLGPFSVGGGDPFPGPGTSSWACDGATHKELLALFTFLVKEPADPAALSGFSPFPRYRIRPEGRTPNAPLHSAEVLRPFKDAALASKAINPAASACPYPT